MDDQNGTIYTSEGGETNIIEVSTNQEPYEGMLFESEDAARVFYDDYASCVGFLTRVLSSRKSERDGSIISRGLECRWVSDNGRKVMQKECGQREFCTAMVLLRQEKPGIVIAGGPRSHDLRPSLCGVCPREMKKEVGLQVEVAALLVLGNRSAHCDVETNLVVTIGWLCTADI
ncbi:unnamed protein product [Prunus brigantina]